MNGIWYYSFVFACCTRVLNPPHTRARLLYAVCSQVCVLYCSSYCCYLCRLALWNKRSTFTWLCPCVLPHLYTELLVRMCIQWFSFFFWFSHLSLYLVQSSLCHHHHHFSAYTHTFRKILNHLFLQKMGTFDVYFYCAPVEFEYIFYSICTEVSPFAIFMWNFCDDRVDSLCVVVVVVLRSFWAHTILIFAIFIHTHTLSFTRMFGVHKPMNAYYKYVGNILQMPVSKLCTNLWLPRPNQLQFECTARERKASMPDNFDA